MAEIAASNLTLARHLNKLWGDGRVTFVLRVVLGSLFILSATSKLPHQVEFIDVVSSYHLLPESLAQFYGTILPWVELAVGCLLIVGLFSRYAAVACILMVASFIVANGTAVYSKAYCGACFGELVTLKTSDALIIDIVIFLVALRILFNRGDLLSIDSLLHRQTR